MLASNAQPTHHKLNACRSWCEHKNGMLAWAVCFVVACVAIDMCVAGTSLLLSGSLKEAEKDGQFWSNLCELIDREDATLHKMDYTYEKEERGIQMSSLSTGVIDYTAWSSTVQKDTELLSLCVRRTQWLRYSGTAHGLWMAVLARSLTGFFVWSATGWDPLRGTGLATVAVWHAQETNQYKWLPVYKSTARFIDTLTDEMLRMHMVLQLGAFAAGGLLMVWLARTAVAVVLDRKTPGWTNTASHESTMHPSPPPTYSISNTCTNVPDGYSGKGVYNYMNRQADLSYRGTRTKSTDQKTVHSSNVNQITQSHEQHSSGRFKGIGLSIDPVQVHDQLQSSDTPDAVQLRTRYIDHIRRTYELSNRNMQSSFT